MSLNKKVLAVAIVGALASSTSFAANLSAPTGAVPAWFAKEIIASEAAPATLNTSASSSTQLNWAVSYNFSENEVRYVRLQCSDNIEFDAATAVTSSGSALIGATNGLGTNVLTFSVTSPLGGPDIVETDTFNVSGNHDITSTDQNVDCSVALYDQPSQAQAGGTVGLIQNTYFAGAYLSFAPSYELFATPTTHVANVEASPSFSSFVPSAPNTTLDTAMIGFQGGTSASFAYRLRDPDGPTGPSGQSATFGVNGAPITLAALLAAGTQIVVDGDYTLVSSAGAAPYNGAAVGRVDLAGLNPSALTATRATFNVGNTGFTAEGMDLTRRAGVLIPASEYRATLDVVAANPTVYRVTDIANVKIGEIVRNGTELQAPLAQIPEGWLSRIVLTNTSSLARPYTIHVMTEEGVTVSTGDLTGTVPANGTKVIESVREIFTGNNRATLVVNVAGPNTAIQGLYQIVNPGSGSISNHVMVRPGTN